MRSLRTAVGAWIFAVGLGALACRPVVYGSIEGDAPVSEGTPRTGASMGEPTMSAPAPGAATTPMFAGACTQAGQSATIGPRLLRRLTVSELDATVRAVFGLDAAAWRGPVVPPDPASLDGFGNNGRRLMVGPDYARGAADTAEAVAALVSADPMLGTLLPCSGVGGSACAETFVSMFGRRLYRRPLDDGELSRYRALYDTISRQNDFHTFIYWAVAAMLQSPHVLYRRELGLPTGDGFYALDPYEVASALAYTYTGGPPDDELLQLAATNRLATPDEREAAARSLVIDENRTVRPAFRRVLLQFADEWLGFSVLDNMEKDAAAFPNFNSDIAGALGEEIRRYWSDAVFDKRGTPAAVLTGAETFVDAKLAAFYGFGDRAASDYARVARPSDWGIGLFAEGALLAVGAHGKETSPTKRGALVRTRFLCGVVPPPPPVVNPLPEPTPASTTRERYEAVHAVNPACKGCHALLDPIGFGFEHFDATGRYRARDSDHEIDAHGTIIGTSAGDLAFDGEAALARAVATLPETSDCFAAYLASYALGIDEAEAPCLVQEAARELRGGSSLVDFYVRLARAPHFRTRHP